MEKRVSKIITGELRDKLLQIREEDCTASFIHGLFGEFNGKRKCNPYDLIEIPEKAYGKDGKKNKKKKTIYLIYLDI